MARFSRIEVYNAMRSTGLVPLFYHPDLEICKEVITACYKGGARLLEFTNRGDFAHEIFGELNKFVAKELPEMILGVGSLTDAGSASLYIQLGTNFVVTPVLREDIALVCNRKKIMWSPGCATLTEISRAEELGCEVVKLFPGDSYGSSFVKAIKGPCPWTEIMPTGGVSPTEESLKEWFGAGVTCVGIGSQLITKEILKTKNYRLLEEKTRFSIETIRQIRS